MNDNAKAWVKALRSGDYKQGRGKLRDGSLFCCLGVACDLAIKAGLVSERGHPFYWGCAAVGDDYVSDGDPDFNRSGNLPFRVMEWLGLRTQSGHMLNGKFLVDINDDIMSPSDFNKIADIIESEPAGLFADKTK